MGNAESGTARQHAEEFDDDGRVAIALRFGNMAPDERILNFVRNSCGGFGQGLIGKNPRWSVRVKASGETKHETYRIDIELISSRLEVRSSSVDGSAFLALSKAFASLTRDVIQTLG